MGNALSNLKSLRQSREKECFGSYPQLVTKDITDDIWIEIFDFLNATDFINIGQLSQHFYYLTTLKHPTRINKYWKYLL